MNTWGHIVTLNDVRPPRLRGVLMRTDKGNGILMGKAIDDVGGVVDTPENLRSHMCAAVR